MSPQICSVTNRLGRNREEKLFEKDKWENILVKIKMDTKQK